MEVLIGICTYASMKEKKLTFANQIKEAVIDLSWVLGRTNLCQYCFKFCEILYVYVMCLTKGFIL